MIEQLLSSFALGPVDFDDATENQLQTPCR